MTMKGKKANKGEWSEPYAAVRIIGDGLVYVADDHGNKNPEEWIDVISLIRKEAKERIVSYQRDPETTDISISVNDDFCMTLPASDFLSLADDICAEILAAKSSKGSFSLSDGVAERLERACFTTTKCASGTDKSDLYLDTRDPRAGVTRSNIGFSVKSDFGRAPTLFNTASASGPKYRLIGGMTDALMNQINEAFDEHGHVDMTKRCRILRESGIKLEFVDFDIAKKKKIPVFRENLDMINPRLPHVIAHVLNAWYVTGKLKDAGLPQILDYLDKDNPLQITRQREKYEYMLKAFLYASYCGLTASNYWNGRSDVNGGFIRVGKNGEVLAFYALESDSFKNYLFDHCRIEQPDTKEGYGNFGNVTKENGQYFFKLNFQVRYTVS